jgi:hypothetical protein
VESEVVEYRFTSKPRSRDERVRDGDPYEVSDQPSLAVKLDLWTGSERVSPFQSRFSITL